MALGSVHHTHWAIETEIGVAEHPFTHPSIDVTAMARNE